MTDVVSATTKDVVMEAQNGPVEETPPIEEYSDDLKCCLCDGLLSNAGVHCLASLKCGHLFGLKCIEEYLDGQNGEPKTNCPVCSGRTSKDDINTIPTSGGGDGNDWKDLFQTETSRTDSLKEALTNVKNTVQTISNTLESIVNMIDG